MIAQRLTAVAAPLLALLATGSATAADAQAAPDGKTLYGQRCSVCHSVVPGAKSAMGPNLSGVVGRKAGSTDYAYSAALKSSGIVWTAANLDKWLAGPDKMIPGSRMPVAVIDAGQRAAIVRYLSAGR